jgi:hypothetical protein
MKISLAFFVLLLSTVSAILEEERGLNDFTIATTGHGVVSTVYSTPTSIITSDGACTVASRSLDTGTLHWRRHVCIVAASSSSDANEVHLNEHRMYKSGPYFYTADHGMVRAWSMDGGALLWETKPTTDSGSGLLTVKTAAAGAKTVLASTSVTGSSMHLYNAINGRSLGTVDVKDAAPGGGTGTQWLSIMSGDGPQSLTALVGTVNAGGEAKGDLLVATLTVDVSPQGDDIVTVGDTRKLSHLKESIVASTLQILERDNQHYGLALTAKGKLVHFSISSDAISQITEVRHPTWTSVKSLEVLDGTVIRVVGSNDRVTPPKTSAALFQYNGDTWGPFGDAASEYDGIAYCAAANLIMASTQGRMEVYDASTNPVKSLPVEFGEIQDVVSLDTVSCEPSSMSVLVSTSKLSSTVLKITDGSSKTAWTTEDGLSTATSALFLDASVTLLQDEAHLLSKLGFMARLQSQLQAGVNIFAHLADSETRDDDFGFVKLALLLSQSVNRIWAIPTYGEHRGTVAWKLDLPSDATWHTMVHGTASSASLVHGIHGGIHSSDVLVLSSTPAETVWSCLDGVTGTVHSTGSSASTAPIAQIIPIFGGGSCRQVAILIHEDKSVSIVPDDHKSNAAVTNELQKSQNGFYSHVVNRRTNSVETYTLLGVDNGFEVQQVGLTTFAGENIVKVAYPQRDEVVQSPCSVVGDGSILLKYLNPHMAVIVTMTDPNSSKKGMTDPLATALTAKKAPPIRKPKGVTQPDSVVADVAPSDDAPNLFVNVVDTVSGRVLHRVSHSNAAIDSKLPVVINENWIVYAFFNDKSRRTELGVLTLYEGMIDKAGITAFTSPKQVLSFSSLEPRESKPVVLSKTYTIVKPVTALGVTATRAGISTRHILIASADDRITSISRQALEPRRPTGQVKPHEKEEGLFQYTPLVPLISMMSPSYNLTIHGVSTFVSSPTALESQSLVLAFGGPDLFFARLSPSHGFDLLPESFSRTLLSGVVVALMVIFLVVKQMGETKAVKNFWA